MVSVACLWMSSQRVPLMAPAGSELPSWSFRRLEAPGVEDLLSRRAFAAQLLAVADLTIAIYVMSFRASPVLKRRKGGVAGDAEEFPRRDGAGSGALLGVVPVMPDLA